MSVTVRASSVMVLACLGFGQMASGAIVRRADTPRFYQHQQGHQQVWPRPAGPAFPPPPPDADPIPLQPGYNNGNWWERGGGWCSVTAWTNAFYYWDNHGFAGLYDHSNLGGIHANQPPPPVGPPAPWDWTHRNAYATEDLSIYTGGCALGDNVHPYLRDHAGAGSNGETGYGYSNSLASGFHRYRLQNVEISPGTFQERVVEVTLGASRVTGFRNFFDFYSDQLLNTTNSVLLKLEPTAASPNDWLGWGLRINYHVVTGTGVDNVAANRTITVSDPDRGSGGAHWGFPYARGAAFPMGAAYDTTLQFDATGNVLVAGGEFPSAIVDEVYTLPEPGSLAMLLLGVSAGAARRRA